MKFKSIIILASLLLLQACSSTPAQTLLPEDIPALYTLPSTPQAQGVLSNASSGMDGEGQADGSSKAVPIELASLSAGTSSASASAIDSGADNVGSAGDICAAVETEINAIDAGLGGPALETAPVTPPTALEKTGQYFYDLGVETILGQLQVFIQTKRAIFDDTEKERIGAEALERGTTRRAYLMGYASAANCDIARS